MHNDKDKLVKITEKTMLKLIKDDIVMPSKYLETFTEERSRIDNAYGGQSLNVMPNEDEIINSSGTLEKIEHHLFETDMGCLKELEEVKSDIILLRKQLFSDDISETKNRLWIFKHKLSDRGTFGDFGFLVSIKIVDYESIIKEYDSNVGNKLLKLVSDYIIRYMKDNHVNYEIVRYAEDNFLIFMHELNEDEVQEHVVNMQKGMANYKFKHRSRMFRLTFYSAVMQYIKNEPFASVLDQLDEKLFQNKM